MLRAGYHRNQSTPGHTVWSTDSYVYCIVITQSLGGLACRKPHGSTTWETFDLSTIAGNPLALPLNDTDNHHRLTLGIDGDGYIYIAGNMHGHNLRMVRSATPGVIDSWTEEGSNVPTGATGVNEMTYPFFFPWGDDLGLSIGQQDLPSSNPLGRDTLLFLRNTGTDTWNPFPGTIDGHLAICDTDTGTPDGERAYVFEYFVDKQRGVLWAFGAWQLIALDGATRTEQYCLRYSDLDGWTSVDGVAVTIPVTRSEANTKCAIPMNAFTNPLGCASPAVDVNGFPMVEFGSWVGGMRYEWDGANWIETVITQDQSLVLFDNEVWRIEANSTGYVMTPLAGGDSYKISGPTTANTFPHIDPAADNLIRIAVPNGDSPAVYEFGHTMPRTT